jgi:hypothetical protein
MSQPPGAIAIELLSETTFSSGGSTAAEVDIEAEHDGNGLPRFGGKALHGVLRDTWVTIAASGPFAELDAAALRIFGPAKDFSEQAILRIGDAEVLPGVRSVVRRAVKRNVEPLTPMTILRSLSDIRYQTAEERTTGAPKRATLRSSRVWLRDLTLYAPLRWLQDPSPEDLLCLAMALRGSRHVGLSRNRGRGFVRMTFANSSSGGQFATDRIAATVLPVINVSGGVE